MRTCIEVAAITSDLAEPGSIGIYDCDGWILWIAAMGLDRDPFTVRGPVRAAGRNRRWCNLPGPPVRTDDPGSSKNAATVITLEHYGVAIRRVLRPIVVDAKS